MTHNDNVKTFEDISRHLELEAERQEVARVDGFANATESTSGRTGSKCKSGKHFFKKGCGEGGNL